MLCASASLHQAHFVCPALTHAHMTTSITMNTYMARETRCVRSHSQFDALRRSAGVSCYANPMGTCRDVRVSDRGLGRIPGNVTR